MKAIAYIRVSTEDQASQGVSLDAQICRIEAYCSMANLDLIEIVREEGVSGSKALSQRPGGMRLIQLVESQDVKHIVSLKLDRLFRDAEDALHQTKKWDKMGIALHLVDLGGQTLNTASAMGRFFLNMMAGFAELERNMISERTEMALRHKKELRQVYSPIPYGFSSQNGDLVANEVEQEVLSKMRNLRLDGLSYHKIANSLNTAGYKTKRSGKWYASTVRYMLNNSLHQ